ncbi:putative membrane protein YeiH [Luteococcus japonicus]|uniref:Putative membrane protein YeiH n=1 Tax=Luteococcus japonicus TaxID=33984 RepID=A0A3N1ZQV3_9ACTN|nr:trimeric intracellular cation channel family protein [Luteococcus japonicus]ROR53078.1 putative membrane protein YeiH [Luteococcus japonicus]
MELLDVIGVFAFALSGGLVGVRRHFDIFGILTLAVVTALGGGIVRDLLLGITPPRNITNLPLVVLALGAGLFTFFFEGTVERLRRLVLVADAVGLAAFCVTGTLTAINAGHPGMEAILVGVITAAGGGAIRDVLAGQVPSVFSPELYALPALLGSVLVDVTQRLGLGGPLTQWLLVALVCALRIAAVKFNWKSPTPRRPERE